MSKSFTLVELLVAVGIIILLTALVLPDYRAGERQFALQRSASKLAQDLRRAQEMAMSAKEPPTAPDTFKGAYGINFQTNSSNYILFADLDNDQIYDSGEEIETLPLEKKVKISNLSPASPLTISFTPPDPTININPSDSLASITLTNNGQTKIIKVNKVGLIYVQ